MAQLTVPAELFVPTVTPATDFASLLAAMERAGTELAGPELAEMERPAGDQTRCVIIDQFEAVFTRCQDEEQRQAFIDAVGELAQTVTVVLALRADFYDQALRYPGLAAALQARQVVLGPMTADQVRRAITEPARRAHLEVEDGLVELLLRELAPKARGSAARGAHEPGALPLLSHALLSAWEHSSTGTITVADYLATGGIADAITRTAEGVFGQLRADQQQLARRLFLRMVHVADDIPPTRSVVRLDDLTGWGGRDAEELLARFVDQRLITVDADSCQLAHEALLTAWPRLRAWVDAGQEDLRTGITARRSGRWLVSSWPRRSPRNTTGSGPNAIALAACTGSSERLRSWWSRSSGWRATRSSSGRRWRWRVMTPTPVRWPSWPGSLEGRTCHSRRS